MNESKKLFRNLQADAKSVLFREQNINDKLLKQIKKSKHEKDFEFVKLFDKNVNFSEDEKNTTSVKTTFVEKKDDIDRSTLYSFGCPFQFLNADFVNSDFSGKSATDPKYCLLFVDLFTFHIKSKCLSNEIQKIHLKRNGNFL